MRRWVVEEALDKEATSFICTLFPAPAEMFTVALLFACEISTRYPAVKSVFPLGKLISELFNQENLNVNLTVLSYSPTTMSDVFNGLTLFAPEQVESLN